VPELTDSIVVAGPVIAAVRADFNRLREHVQRHDSKAKQSKASEDSDVHLMDDLHLSLYRPMSLQLEERARCF
jgi:hypothetical protein